MQLSLRCAAQLKTDIEQLIAETPSPPMKMGIYEPDELPADVLSEADITRFKHELADVKRQLRDVSGVLIDLNSRTTVELAEPDAAWLKEQGVI